MLPTQDPGDSEVHVCNFCGIVSRVLLWEDRLERPMNSSPQPARPRQDWKLLYDAAVRETDPRKLPERIASAQNAILNRIEESMRSPAFGEHCAMNDALRNLRRLEKVPTSRKRLSAFLW